MKRIRAISVLLVLVMLMGLLAGCGSNSTEPETEPTPEAAAPADENPAPPADDGEQAPDEPEDEPGGPVYLKYAAPEPLEYSMWMGLSMAVTNIIDPAKELTLFREINDRLNVSFDLQVVSPEAMETAFGVMIASREYCDIISEMNNYDLGIEDAIDNEIIRDVYDLVKEYAPNYWDELTNHVSSYMSLTTESGYMGSLAVLLTDESAVSEQFGYITNGAWYDEFGMDIATTLDEFHEYLTKAHDTYGAQFSFVDSGIESGVMSAWNITNEVYVVDGEIRYGYLQDEMREYLETMNQWYKEGLLEDGFYNGQTDTGARLAGSASGRFSAWSGNAPVSVNVYKFDDEGHTSQVAGTPYLKMNKDDQIHTLSDVSYLSQIGSNAWSFRYDLPDEDVIALLKIVDYMFTDEGDLLFNYGVEGEAFEYNANGEPEWTDLVINNPDGLMWNATSYIYASHNGTTFCPGLLNLTKGFYGFTDEQWQALDAFTTAGDSEYTIPKSVTLNVDESETYYSRYSDLDTYTSAAIIEFIIGDGITDAAWDDFIAQLHALGIDDMIAAYQSAYDRYFDLYEAAEALIGK